jgi:hypothetical protein
VLLALYSPARQLVSSFGTGGSELVAVGNGGNAQTNAVVLNGSNVLVVAGRAVNGSAYEEFCEAFNASTGAAVSSTKYLGSFGTQTDTEANAITVDGSDVLLAGFTSTAKHVLVVGESRQHRQRRARQRRASRYPRHSQVAGPAHVHRQGRPAYGAAANRARCQGLTRPEPNAATARPVGRHPVTRADGRQEAGLQPHAHAAPLNAARVGGLRRPPSPRGSVRPARPSA